MKLLAIDPSFVGSGITTYENGVYNYYIIKTDKQSKNSNDIIRRIIEIKKELYIIINRFNPDYVIIEGPSFGSRSSSLVQMGALNYSIREMLLDEGIKFIVSPPTVVKKYWTGKGNANKQLMIEQAYDRNCNIDIIKNYGTKKDPDDRFDDNVVDSRALCDFLKDYFEDKLNGLEKQIEVSWA